jgi:hypothetical protein
VFRHERSVIESGSIVDGERKMKIVWRASVSMLRSRGEREMVMTDANDVATAIIVTGVEAAHRTDTDDQDTIPRMNVQLQPCCHTRYEKFLGPVHPTPVLNIQDTQHQPFLTLRRFLSRI